MADYDYTRDDNSAGPDDSWLDDFTVAPVTVAQTADQIEQDNNFDVPAGEHTFVVTGFGGPPESKFHKVMLDGQLTGYTAKTIRVKFGMAANTKRTVNEFFTLPPDNPAEHPAYFRGQAVDPSTLKVKPNASPGWFASQFCYFIQRLGFPCAPGQKLPEAAQHPRNWIGRAIVATVAPSKPNATTGKVYMNIKMFSYKPANHASTMGGHVGHANGGNGGGPHGAGVGITGQPVGAGASAALSNGLDDI